MVTPQFLLIYQHHSANRQQPIKPHFNAIKQTSRSLVFLVMIIHVSYSAQHHDVEGLPVSKTNDLNLAKFNINIHHSKGIGNWRALYIRFFEKFPFDSIVELGSGAPDFLSSLPCQRKIAIDAGDRYASEFSQHGIELFVADLDHAELPAIKDIDVAVCSDVFEHLVFPSRSLDFIQNALKPDGVLFSHVPNEFVLRKTVKIMLGLSGSMYFHTDYAEHEDPHLRRFSRLGYEKFLQTRFQFNLFIGDLRYSRIAKVLHTLRIPVPYALQGGPTYISTNCESRFNQLTAIKKELAKHRL